MKTAGRSLRGLRPDSPEFDKWAANVSVSDGCWAWTGPRNPEGYGLVSLRGRSERAHRVAWATLRWPLRQGEMVLHRCDNPPCCNPEHLFVGDARTNIIDCRDKGRLPDKRGEAHPQSKLTDDIVRDIRFRLSQGERGTDIARLYGIDKKLVTFVKQGRRWGHVTAAGSAAT